MCDGTPQHCSTTLFPETTTMHAHVDFYNAKIKASMFDNNVDLEIERAQCSPSMRIAMDRDEAAALVDQMILAIAAVDRQTAAASAA